MIFRTVVQQLISFQLT